MRARHIVLVVTMAALVGAGCGDGDDRVTSATSTSTSSSTSIAPAVTTVPVATTGATGTTVAGVTTTAPATARIVLEPDGLGVVAFGAAKDATISTISALLGPLDETGTGCELGGAGSTTARWKELRVEFGPDGLLRSYQVRLPPGMGPVFDLETQAGIGLDSTVTQLQTAYGSRLSIPGLPPEFGGDDFAVSFPGTERRILGSLSGTSPGGTVKAIFTQVCE